MARFCFNLRCYILISNLLCLEAEVLLEQLELNVFHRPAFINSESAWLILIKATRIQVWVVVHHRIVLILHHVWWRMVWMSGLWINQFATFCLLVRYTLRWVLLFGLRRVAISVFRWSLVGFRRGCWALFELFKSIYFVMNQAWDRGNREVLQNNVLLL